MTTWIIVLVLALLTLAFARPLTTLYYQVIDRAQSVPYVMTCEVQDPEGAWHEESWLVPLPTRSIRLMNDWGVIPVIEEYGFAEGWDYLSPKYGFRPGDRVFTRNVRLDPANR